MISSTQVRTLIEHMVRSGTISGDVADNWTEMIKNLDAVKSLRDAADTGNVEAMSALGFGYRDGSHVRYAIRRSADAGLVKAPTNFAARV